MEDIKSEYGFDYVKTTYNGKFGPFEYLLVPKSEYDDKLVAKVNDLPFLLSEWREFYFARFAMVNCIKEYEIGGINTPDFIHLPIITDKECWDFGL